MALADGYIGGFEAKYYYNYWRPVTAIQLVVGTCSSWYRGNRDKRALESSLELAYIGVNEDNPMRTVEEIVEEIDLLPPQERCRLIEKITVRGQQEKIAEEARLAALDAFLALAGKAETDYSDVASDKYKHLADIYGDTHELP